MKKVRLIIVASIILFSVNLFAQEHLSFKGIPITGKSAAYVEQLKNQAFTFIKTEGNISVLEGTFINLPCTIYTIGSINTNTIWKVHLTFSDEISWSSLKGSYNTIKGQYQTKYGTGESYEYFTKPYYEGDGYELQAIAKEKCSYATYWNTDLGYISVKISGKHVAISYEDKIGADVNRAEKQQVVNNDI